MSRFTEQERAEIFRRSRELLDGDRPAATPPTSAPTPTPELVFEDQMDRWRREADERDKQRAAAKAELKRARDAARANWSEWDAYVDARIAAALAERQHEIVELANSSVAFAKAVDKKLAELERLLTKITDTHKELR